MANTTLNLRVNAQFDELTQLNAEAQRSRDKIAAMEQASKILGKTVDTTDAAVEAHIKSLKTLQKNLDQNSEEYRQTQQELDRYSKKVDDTTLKFKSFGESINDLKQSFVSLVALETVIETFQAIADAAVQMFNNIADASLEVQNLANVLDTSAESVDRVRILFERYGSDLRDYGDFTAELTEKLSDLSSELRAGGELSEQTNKFQQVLKNLGVNALDAAGNVRNIQDVAIEFARGISRLSGTERVNYIAAVMGSPAESARLLTVLERVGVEFDKQDSIINDDFVQRVREFRIQQEKLNEAFQRLIVDNSDAIIRFLQLMLQIMERLVPVIDTVIKTISLIPTEAFEIGVIAAFAPLLLPNYIATRGIQMGARLTQKPATIYEDDLRFTPPGLTRPPAPQLQQQEKEADDKAEKREQKLFDLRKNHAEKLFELESNLRQRLQDQTKNYLEWEKNFVTKFQDQLEQRRQSQDERARRALRERYDAEVEQQRLLEDVSRELAIARGQPVTPQAQIAFQRSLQDLELQRKRDVEDINLKQIEDEKKLQQLKLQGQDELMKRMTDYINSVSNVVIDFQKQMTNEVKRFNDQINKGQQNGRGGGDMKGGNAVNPLPFLPRNAPGITVSPTAENVNWSQVGTRHGQLGGNNRSALSPDASYQIDQTAINLGRQLAQRVPIILTPFNDYIDKLQTRGTELTQLETGTRLSDPEILRLARAQLPELTAEYQRQTDSIRQQEESQRRQLELIRSGVTPEVARQRTEFEQINNVRLEELGQIQSQLTYLQQSSQLTGEQKIIVDQSLQAVKDLTVQYGELPGLIAAANEKQQAFLDRQQQIQSLSVGIANALGQGVRESLLLAINGTQNWGEALDKIIVNVLNEIINQLLYILVIQPLVNNISKGLSGLFGGILPFGSGGVMTSAGAVDLPMTSYAYGGIANKPQLAVFGEGSMPEAYVPLPDGRRIPVVLSGSSGGGNTVIGGSTSVVVNVDASNTKAAGDTPKANQLGDQIAKVVQAEIIKQQRPGGLLY